MGRPKQGGLLDSGRYSHHIQRYMKCFDSSQIQIIYLDEFNKNSEEVLSSLFEFLNVDCSFSVPESSLNLNVATVAKYKIFSRLLTRVIQLPNRKIKKAENQCFSFTRQRPGRSIGKFRELKGC